MFGFIDPLYLVIMLPLFLLGVAASLFLRYIYRKYSNTINSKNLNGMDTVAKIAEYYGYNVDLQQGEGDLSDHYNPLNKTVSLSPDVAKKPSIASVGIAAHEMGHVAQHHNSFILTSIRTTIAPVVGFGSSIGYFLIIIGLVLAGSGLSWLAWVGLILFSATTVFSLITLPVEIDASRRALNMVQELQLVDVTKIGAVRLVLFAAALTYVASLIQSLGNLLYFFIRVNSANRN